MDGVITRGRAAAEYACLPSKHLTLKSGAAVRLEAYLCNLNSTYASSIVTLEIDLDRKELDPVLIHLNTILRRAVRIEYLVLPAIRLPRSVQLYIFHKVFLRGLWSVSMGEASYPAILDFLRRHRSSLRDVRFTGRGRRYPALASVDPSQLLTLESIAGSTRYVADIMSHCSPLVTPEITFTGQTSPTILQEVQASFVPFPIRNVVITLPSRSFRTVAYMPACFPVIYCLKLVEPRTMHPTHRHVWSVTRWKEALSAMVTLERLTIDVSENFYAPPNVCQWFSEGDAPPAASAPRRIEITSDNQLLHTWYKIPRRPWYEYQRH